MRYTDYGFGSLHSQTFYHVVNRTRARRGTSKAKEKEDKFKKMMDEVDAMLEGSSSEKEDTPQGDDSGSDIFDESDYNNDEDDDDE